MRRKITLLTVLTILFTVTALVIPSMKHIASALPEGERIPVMEEVSNSTMIQKDQKVKQDLGDLVVTDALSADFEFSITDSELTADEYATITMTMTGNAYPVDYAFLNFVVFYEEKAFLTYVYMEPVSDTVFQGEVYIYSDTVSGSYDMYSVELISDSFGYYDEILSDFYYTEADGNLADLPENLFTVTGTLGGYQPETILSFGKDTYTLGESINVRLEVDESVVDMTGADITLGQYEDDFTKSFWVGLEETSDGVFEGSYEVTTHLSSGTYNVEQIYLYSDGYSINIYDETYDTYYDGQADYVDDYGNSFSISGTVSDKISPEIQSISIDKTVIGKNESVIITVKATDDLSGLGGGSVEIAGNNIDWTMGDLEVVDENTLIYEFKPSPFYPTDSAYEIVAVNVLDVARNSTYVSNDYDPLTFQVNGYSNIGEISGSNRYNTAIEISRQFWNTDTVIIALGSDFPDALSAGPLSYELNAPILLALNQRVSTSTLNEIRRLGATNAILLGGPAAISEAVVSQLHEAGIRNVERIYGTNRYWTAVAVGEYLFEQQESYGSKSEYAVLASGNSFPDALAVSSLASVAGRPILLTSSSRLHPETRRFLEEEGIKYLSVIGGPSVISEDIVNEIKAMGILVNRHAGANRYETSVAIAEHFFPESSIAFAANGMNFADALAAAPLAAKWDAPILLTRDTTLPGVVTRYLENSTNNLITHVTVVGGDSAVGDSVKKTMSVALLSR